MEGLEPDLKEQREEKMQPWDYWQFFMFMVSILLLFLVAFLAASLESKVNDLENRTIAEIPEGYYYADLCLQRAGEPNTTCPWDINLTNCWDPGECKWWVSTVLPDHCVISKTDSLIC